jgi:uncharacterized protein (TIGR04141 family)
MCKITLYELTQGSLSENGVKQVLVKTAPDRIREISLNAELKDQARFFILEDDRPQPDWFRYMKPILADPNATIKSTASLGGLLLIKPDVHSHFYAAAWGMARFLLQPDVIRKDLGIICALNLLCAKGKPWDPECIRSISSKRIDANTLNSYFQFARQTSFESFPFIVDTDQLRSITGTPIEKEKWGTITGGVPINFRSPSDAAGIIDICRQIEEIRKKDDYREHFDFVDNIRAISETSILKVLYRRFTEQIKSGDTAQFFLSPPEIVDWAEIAKFQYVFTGEGQQNTEMVKEVEEPTLESILDFIHSPEIFNTLGDVLFTDALMLRALDANGLTIDSWLLSSWIGAELSQTNADGKTIYYILDFGEFFIIDHDYMDALNRFVSAAEITKADEIAPFQVEPARVRVKPDWVKTQPDKKYPEEYDMKEFPEDNYVNALVNQNLPDSLRLHKRLVSDNSKIEGITTPIEICDLAMETPHMLVHLKVGTGSSSLSHLFSQAVVSAELLEANPTFRKKTHEIVDEGKDEDGAYTAKPDAFKWLYSDSLDPRKVTVVMGMITDTTKPLADALPFFSKVNFRMRCHNLMRMGYRYGMVKISYVKIE